MRWASRSNSVEVSATSAPAAWARRAVDVDAHLADHAAPPRAGDAPGAAQHGPHPRHELARAERLGDVVVGAQLQAEHAVDLVVAGGHEQHRRPVVRPARSRRQTSTPSSPGSPTSSTTASGPQPAHGRERRLAVALDLHAEPVAAQVEADQVGDRPVVLHDHAGPRTPRMVARPTPDQGRHRVRVR